MDIAQPYMENHAAYGYSITSYKFSVTTVMKAEIIAVGTELLLGEVANTNAVYLSQRMAECGIDVYRHTTVGDNRARLIDVLSEAFARADIVITTGGLGPTADDITKDAVAAHFGLALELHQPSLLAIKAFFDRMGHEMKENNKRQAYLPEGAMVLDNPAGTAPGCIVSVGGKKCILLPGPPKEVDVMYRRHVKDYLMQYSREVLVSLTLRFVGIGESAMEDAVKDIVQAQGNPSIAPYAVDRPGEVTLRLCAKAKTEDDARMMILPVAGRIKERLGEFIYGENDDSLAQVVVAMLRGIGLRLAAAESITGGAFAAAVVSVPGASYVLNESYVVYSNHSKTKLLGVSEATLESHGAVSSQTAEEMAQGALKAASADISISFTGVAGPDGGTQEKPVGLTYIGLCYKGRTEVGKHILFGDRNRIRDRVVALGLDMIRRAILAI